ncbi:uncharacterized protein [Eurosta solidaginis]|uniref:uncharacterized protein isoform X2 n=1 Tax=Eurosta solidaginis TaxID=178769 RepID=UPI0035307302
MFHYIAYLCLLVGVTAHNAGFSYATASIPVPQVHSAPRAEVPPIVPAASYEHKEQAVPLKYEIHKEFYFFKAPEEGETVAPAQQFATTLSQSSPKPVVSQQQINTHYHSAEPVIHYINYKTPAEAQQILKQFIGDNFVDLSRQLITSNHQHHHITSHVNSQYHITSNANAAFSNVNTQIKLAKSEKVPFSYETPSASNVESSYHVPATSNERSQYVVDLPSANTLNSQYLLPAVSNVDNELQTSDV